MIPDRTLPGGSPIGTADDQTDAQARRVMMSTMKWVEPVEEELPKYALHVYLQDEPELIIRGDDLLALRRRAESIANSGAWLDDEYWPAHSIHHCWLETVSQGVVLDYGSQSPNYDRDEDDAS